MCGGTATEVKHALPVAAVVLGTITGRGKIGYFVVLPACVGHFIHQQGVHGQTQFFVSLTYVAVSEHAHQGSALFVGQCVGRQMFDG